MSAVVQLSSSPPRIFARSPTRVEFSSPLRSTDVNPRIENHSRSPCSLPQTSRDGFSSEFVSARKVLGDKPGAENAPTLQNSKIKQVSAETDANTTSRSPKFLHPSPRKYLIPRILPSVPAAVDSIEDSECVIVKVLPSDLKKNKKPPKKLPVKNNVLLARRTDWTPPRYATVWDEDPEIRLLDFGQKLAQYGHVEEDSSFEKLPNNSDGEFTKRRKVDVIESKAKKTRSTESTAGAKKPTRRRSKSPTKKSLTITGLATSNYLGEEQKKSTPMMQYLVSTQAKMGEDQACGTFETKIKKRHASRAKKTQSKSKLKSPQTVLKTLESQELVFASASQLARDEELGVTRTPTHGSKPLDSNLMSDPYPTQQSAIVSIESTTPKTGTSRYRAHRSLWSAADRDDDNALLHLHGAFDSPILKEAFAGKDALFEQGMVNMRSCESDSISEHQRISNESGAIFDISEITTPVLITAAKPFPSITKRAYSSASKSPNFKRTKPTRESETRQTLQLSQSTKTDKATSQHQSGPASTKPDYALFSDDDLKKELKTLGVKGMRKRENMIKRLETLWAAEHGVELDLVQAKTKVFQHGDLLSKVHDFTQRPAPKKPKKPRTAKSESGSKKQKPDKHVPKSGNQQDLNKNGEYHGDDLVEQCLDSLARETQVVLDGEVIEPSTAPVRGTGVKATSSSTLASTSQKSKGKMRAEPHLLTPPPTFTAAPTGPPSSPGFDDLTSVTSTDTNPPPEDHDDQSLKSKIILALRHVNAKDKGRNHQTNPTWWEKIQMYDPIVLEDFTTWLNTEGLGAIGEDGEIDANEVKAWCEEVGVCCLWKGGWRGNKMNSKSGE